MGTFNYQESKVVTLAIKPYSYYDFEKDQSFMDEIRECADEWGIPVSDTIDEVINRWYEDDHYNAECIINEYDFRWFNVTIEPGYYEGCQIDIDVDFDFTVWDDKREALKEATQLKKMLHELNGIGFNATNPFWCPDWFNYEETKNEINTAIKSLKEDIREEPTWWTYEHKINMGVESC